MDLKREEGARTIRVRHESKGIMQEQSQKKSSHDTSVKSSYPQWHNFVAGGVAGATCRMLIAPFDLLKIRMQVMTESGGMGMVSSFLNIMKNEGGVRALFRGTVAATYLWIGYSAVQFSLHSRSTNFLSTPMEDNIHKSLPALQPVFTLAETCRQNISSNPTALAFVSGGVAGVAATLATYPFDICRTIFAVEGLSSTAKLSSFKPPESILEFSRVMFQRNGILGFYAGSVPAVAHIIPYMGVNFALYDYLVRNGNEKNVGSAGIAGFVSGGVSKVIAHPLDTVKKRLQTQTYQASSKVGYQGMVDCICKVTKEEGILAFYRGLAPTVLKSMVDTSVTFASFTLTKNVLETIHDYRKQQM